MKKEVVLFTMVGLMLLGTGYLLGKSDPANVCTRKHQNLIDDGRIVIIPADPVDGRLTYTVLLKDEEALESMYGEEIGNSLSTGTWGYNEMLRIIERP